MFAMKEMINDLLDINLFDALRRLENRKFVDSIIRQDLH